MHLCIYQRSQLLRLLSSMQLGSKRVSNFCIIHDSPEKQTLTKGWLLKELDYVDFLRTAVWFIKLKYKKHQPPGSICLLCSSLPSPPIPDQASPANPISFFPCFAVFPHMLLSSHLPFSFNFSLLVFFFFLPALPYRFSRSSFLPLLSFPHSLSFYFFPLSRPSTYQSHHYSISFSHKISSSPFGTPAASSLPTHGPPSGIFQARHGFHIKSLSVCYRGLTPDILDTAARGQWRTRPSSQ